MTEATSRYLNQSARSEAEYWKQKHEEAEAECERLRGLARAYELTGSSFMNRSEYWRERAGREGRDALEAQALVEESADALEAVVRRHGYFAGKPLNLPPDDPIAIARATLEKVRKP